MDTAEFFYGVAASLLAGVILAWFWPTIKWAANLSIPAIFPKMRGFWIGKYQEYNKEYVEDIHVKQQFIKYFSGVFVSIRDSERIEYQFNAEFIDRENIRVFFNPAKKHHNDLGVGLFRLGRSANKLDGIAISYDFTTGKLTSRVYEAVQNKA